MSDAPGAWDDMVLVGRVARTHGLRGHVVIHAETDFPETRFAPGAVCWTRLDARPVALVVQAVRMQNGRPLVAFEGYDTIEAVEPLLGLELRVPEGALVPLPEGVYYHHQLVGCEVETVGGVAIGPVGRVEEGAGGSLLVVQGAAGDVLVPLVADICVTIDVERRRIAIQPPEGLIELNAPGGHGRRRSRAAARRPAGPVETP